MVIHGCVQSGKYLNHPMHMYPAETKYGNILTFCSSSHTVNKFLFMANLMPRLVFVYFFFFLRVLFIGDFTI